MAGRRPTGRFGGGGDQWFPPSTPIAVEGGLLARSQRGRIGGTWWSQRFIAVLESYGIGTRLQRGKRYARTGQVLSMEVSAGQVRASVQGSRTKPYRVFIETAVLTDTEWDAVEAVMTSSAVFLARLLADEMPEEIEEVFIDASSTLFPLSGDEIDSACSCPDWENPCKHIAAVYYLLAEAFDVDPFLIFAWRGRSKAELLSHLRSRRRGSEARVEPVVGSSTGARSSRDFGWPEADAGADEQHGYSWAPMQRGSLWGNRADVEAVEIHPRLAVAPDLLLRQLDPAPLGPDGEAVAERLRPLYEAITQGAVALSLSEEGS